MTVDENALEGVFDLTVAGGAAVERRLGAWREAGYSRRLWAHDPTLWAEKGTPEIEDRLGWLDLPRSMSDLAGELADFGGEVRDAGVRDVVLLGMGGSSLAPEVFQRTFGVSPGYPRLRVLDSTHPAAVAGLGEDVRVSETLFVVSSKSGTTLETLSLFRYFWALAAAELEDPGGRFVAVTDPGSTLERLGAERRFRRVFLAPSDVGGRYSALTPFGLVPAAMIGVDPRLLLASAAEMAGACGPSVDEAASPGLYLGAALGELALAGRDKLTLMTTPALAGFPDWIEQLVAESTGKNDRGIVPIVGEAARRPAAYGGDRFFVGIGLVGDGPEELRRRIEELAEAGHPTAYFELPDPAGLGMEIVRWEVAVAAAGSALGIQPFDQPDVQLAKTMAKEAMASDAPAGVADLPQVALGEDVAAALETWVLSARKGDSVDPGLPGAERGR